MKKIISYLIILLVLTLGRAWAANYDNPIEGVLKAVFGQTITMEVPSLVSKSPTNGNQNGNLTFRINSSTAYVNFSELSDLAEGDQLQIAYTEDPSSKSNQEMLATKIIKISDINQVGAANTAGSVVVNPTVTSSAQSNGSTVTTTTTTQINSP